jgi:hypothetical protein
MPQIPKRNVSESADVTRFPLLSASCRPWQAAYVQQQRYACNAMLVAGAALQETEREVHIYLFIVSNQRCCDSGSEEQRVRKWSHPCTDGLLLQQSVSDPCIRPRRNGRAWSEVTPDQTRCNKQTSAWPNRSFSVLVASGCTCARQVLLPSALRSLFARRARCE